MSSSSSNSSALISGECDRPSGADALAFADGLSRSSPSKAGVDAAAVEAFLDDVDAAKLELHSLMLHRAGAVVAEAWWWPYRADRPHVMHSLAKSVTACAIGLALEERRFGLHDKVISFFPEFLPQAIDNNLAAMTVENLLTMRTGHAHETSGAEWRGLDTSWIAEFFKIPVVFQPGTTYVYTSAASYMLSAILTKTTGESLHRYLKPRLFEPLGIKGEHWDVGPDGINPGGNGLTCKTADILKLGILHAQRGLWNGSRLLPEAWVADATRPHGGDYGYHWITGPKGDFSALGMFVQMALVFPQYGATLALTAGIAQSTEIMPLLYKHFPGAFLDGPIDNAKADAGLARRLARAAGPKISSSALSPLPARISGVAYRVAPNAQKVDAVRFDFPGSKCIFTLTDDNGEHAVEMGIGGWIESRTSLPGRDLHHGYQLDDAPTVAGARWRDAKTLEMTWIFAETAFRDTIVCRFDGDTVTLDRAVNVNSGALSYPTFSGVAAG